MVDFKLNWCAQWCMVCTRLGIWVLVLAVEKTWILYEPLKIKLWIKMAGNKTEIFSVSWKVQLIFLLCTHNKFIEVLELCLGITLVKASSLLTCLWHFTVTLCITRVAEHPCHCSCVDEQERASCHQRNLPTLAAVLTVSLLASSRCHNVSKFITRVNQKSLFFPPHD
jgi:hypothetical protein